VVISWNDWVVYSQELFGADHGGLAFSESVCFVCRLALNVSTDDVVTVLKSDTSLPWMAQLNL